MGKPNNTIQSIQTKILKHPSGCWEWMSALDKFGYGQCRFNGKNWKSHRLFYSLFKGPIPNGLFVCHSCDNKKCVNPDHLWLGTAQDNSTDMKIKGRSKNQYSL